MAAGLRLVSKTMPQKKTYSSGTEKEQGRREKSKDQGMFSCVL